MAAIKIESLDHHYTLHLFTLNEEPVGELLGVNSFSFSPNLVGPNELNLTLNFQLESGDTSLIYESIGEDMLLLVNQEEYYYIDSCEETEDSLSGAREKVIHAFGREHELSFKRFGPYEPETERFLYFRHPSDGSSVAYPWTSIPSDNRLAEFLTSTIDPDGYEYGIFNEIEKNTTWKLKRGSDGKPEIPQELRTEVRFLSFSEQNILEVLASIQEAWDVVFIYDTKKREISLKQAQDFDLTPMGVLSSESFITNLKKQIKRNEIKTRLHLYNMYGEGVLAERMAHGHSYIEDYSYYQENGYLSNHLNIALNSYLSTLAALQTQTTAAWNTLRSLIEEKYATMTKIKHWEQDLVGPTMSFEYYLSIEKGYIVDKGLPTEQVITPPRELTETEEDSKKAAKAQIDAIVANIELYKNGILSSAPRGLNQIDGLIEAKKTELKNLQQRALMKNVFSSYEALNSLPTGSLEAEMEPFIRDATFQSEHIEDSLDLLKQGVSILGDISRPMLKIELGLVDFLSYVEFKDARFMATLGQVLRIESKDGNFVENVILLKYTHDPIEKNLTFEFSGNLKLENNASFLAGLISQSSSTSSQVSFKGSNWDDKVSEEAFFELRKNSNSLFSRISNSEGDVSTLFQTADEIRAQVEDAEDNIASLEIRADGIQTQVSNNAGNISTLTQTANGLSSRVSTAEGNISTLTQTASGLSSRVSTAEGDISTLKQTATSLQSQITSNDGDISTLTQTANGLSSRVSTAEGNISTLTQTASGLSSRVSTAEGNISTLTQTAGSIEAKINTTTHSLTQSGYTLRDTNGSALITPNGMANEQNIGRVDNVEAGYPMKIPFHIGAEVSQITQAILKWDMSNFRTYSKGAASGGGTKTTPSGGGSTSGPSSRSTAENSGPVAFVSNTQTELSYPNEGKHYHRITAEQMAHSHGMAHTHTTPSHAHSLDITHEHAPVFGILETGITVDYIIGITIDGVWRAQVNATRGEINLSTWITTNGWHQLILSVNGIKRLDANLFLKTYIRR